MCDVESYIYMPMLEELELRADAAVRVRRGDPALRAVDRREVRPRRRRAVPHRRDARRRGTKPRRAGASRRTGATISRRAYYVLAVGILNLMKLPAIPGMEDFAGPLVPHRAVGLPRTPAAAPTQPLDKLRARPSALSGPAPPASRRLPPVAEAADHVYVFQRTPSAIGVRGNRPTSTRLREVAQARLAARTHGQLPGANARQRRSTPISSTTGGHITTRRRRTRRAGRA